METAGLEGVQLNAEVDPRDDIPCATFYELKIFAPELSARFVRAVYVRPSACSCLVLDQIRVHFPALRDIPSPAVPEVGGLPYHLLVCHGAVLLSHRSPSSIPKRNKLHAVPVRTLSC
jgi:hypothetical protein